MEVKINRKLDYALFIVKSADNLPGYSGFARDPFGNTVQHSQKTGFDFKDILSHLEELKKYGR